MQKSLYGGTINLVNTEFKKFNIEFDYVDVSNKDEFEGALNSKTKIIYIESPSNPLLSITIGRVNHPCCNQKKLRVLDEDNARSYFSRFIEVGVNVPNG